MRVEIDGLQPQTWYTIAVRAESEAGSTEAEYNVLTPVFRDTSECFEDSDISSKYFLLHNSSRDLREHADGPQVLSAGT